MTGESRREGARVRVWTVDLDEPPDVIGRATEVLDADEIARAGRLHDESARRRWTLAHGALREILAACVGVDAGDLEFDSGSSGKPILRATGAPRVQFNLAHSGAVALVAVCADYDVGVDVEVERPGVDTLGVARRVLGGDVVRSLQALEGDERRRAFFAAWARHEAAVKCRGTSVTSGAGARQGLLEKEITLGDGYAGAVALDPGDDGPSSMALSVERWLWGPGGGAAA